jgi:hypothetical protein
MTNRKRRPSELNRASAYYRLAAKADKAGQYKQGAHWRDIADRLVAKYQRERSR